MLCSAAPQYEHDVVTAHMAVDGSSQMCVAYFRQPYSTAYIRCSDNTRAAVHPCLLLCTFVSDEYWNKLDRLLHCTALIVCACAVTCIHERIFQINAFLWV